MINLNVLLFSILKEKLGRGSLSVTLGANATGKELLDVLSEQHEVIRTYRSVIRLAVNEAYVNEGIGLNEGDEVALITPVSGG